MKKKDYKQYPTHLSPCPYCGCRVPVVIQGMTGTFHVECMACGNGTRGFHSVSKAYDRWQARVDPVETLTMEDRV
jgi:hypothetical protein